MRKLLLSYVIFLFSTYARLSFANEQVHLVDALQKISTQAYEIQEKSKGISDEKDELEGSLTEIENLYDKIRRELDNNAIMIEVQDAINEAQEKTGNIELCEDVLISVFEELVVAIGDNVTEPIQKNLQDITVQLEELEDDLQHIKQVIVDELRKPEAHLSVCENDNEYCKLIDKLEHRIKTDYETAEELGNLLSGLIKDSLSYIRVGEIDSEIQNTVLTPVVKCLEENTKPKILD